MKGILKQPSADDWSLDIPNEKDKVIGDVDDPFAIVLEESSVGN